MKRILVATDFSTRSDRALRRATLLARSTKSNLVLVHAIDSDQPRQLLEAERQVADVLLVDLATTILETDNISCDVRLALGDPFQAIVQAAEDAEADLIVMGPHRRQLLRDVFVGTTVERTIRLSRRPVVMANAVPARSYGRTIIATDFSDCSARAVQAAQNLGFIQMAEAIALHVFEAPAQYLMSRTMMAGTQQQDYIAKEEQRAQIELKEFLDKVAFKPDRQVVRLLESTAAQAILEYARRQRADLVVIGTHGRTGLEKILLGSVAEALLRDAEVDILAVPPRAETAAGPAE